jgi:tetratricopeptide (TPR) repeat protein
MSKGIAVTISAVIFVMSCSHTTPAQESKMFFSLQASKGRKLPPATAVRRLDLGNFNLFHGNSSHAIAAYKQALELKPDMWEARYGLVSCYIAKKRYKSAIKECRIILSSKPNHKDTLFVLGNLLMSQGKPAEAIPYLRQAINAGMRGDAASTTLALALAQANQLPEAERLLSKVLANSKRKNPEAHLGKAVIFFKQSRQADAVAELDRALQEKPRYAQARNFKADILFATGDMDGAKKTYSEEIAKDDALPAAFQALGNIYLNENALESAFAVFEKGERWYPEDYQIALGKAVTLEKQGRTSEAMKAYLRAISLHTDARAAQPWIKHLKELSTAYHQGRPAATPGYGESTSGPKRLRSTLGK